MGNITFFMLSLSSSACARLHHGSSIRALWGRIRFTMWHCSEQRALGHREEWDSSALCPLPPNLIVGPEVSWEKGIAPSESGRHRGSPSCYHQLKITGFYFLHPSCTEKRELGIKTACVESTSPRSIPQLCYPMKTAFVFKLWSPWALGCQALTQ